MNYIDNFGNWFNQTDIAARYRAAASSSLAMHSHALMGATAAGRTDFVAKPATRTGPDAWSPPIT